MQARQQLDRIESLGGATRQAVQAANTLIEQNKFMGTKSARLLKLGSWALSAGGTTLAMTALAAAPVAAVIGVAAAIGVAAIGNSVSRLAGEKEAIRESQQHFLAEAQIVMRDIKRAHAIVSDEVRSDASKSFEASTDFLEYQKDHIQNSLNETLALQQDNGQSPSVEAEQKARQAPGPR